MTNHEDRPWAVFAGRPAPLAALARHQDERRRPTDADGEGEGDTSVADSTPPAPDSPSSS